MWTAIELAVTGPPQGWVLGGFFLTLAVVASEYGRKTSVPAWDRVSRVLLGLVFVAERILWSGPDPIPLMAFVVLLIGLGVFQSLERTFSPVYEAIQDPETERMVDIASVGTYVRAIGLLGITFAISFFLSLLVPFAILRVSTLGAVLALAAGLIAVISFLAVFQPLGRRVQRGSAQSRPR